MGVSAINTGNNLLFLITSFLLSFMAVSGFFGRYNIQNLDLEIEFPQEIYAKKEVYFIFKLINKKRLPSFLIKLKFYDKEIVFPYFEKEISKRESLVFPKRGLYKINELQFSSPFPFNFFVRYYNLKKSFEFIVFPEPKKVIIYENLISQKEKNGEYESQIKSGYDGDIKSIKDYINGTPKKYIDWKSSAKTGSLKIKEFDSLINKPLIIEFDKIKAKNLEDKISFISFLIMDNFKKGIPVGLKIKDKFFKPDFSFNHKLNLLRELALYE
ncbi:MAG: DUF58 domain-containing protein [Caldisericia bacterium]|nr:DUF58 domain-containing protein [Caldisericia bacterium]